MICVRALARDQQSRPALLRALQGSAWRVRAAAARALGHALHDEDERVAASAERALDHLRSTN